MGDRTANKDGIISKLLWYYLLSSGLPQRPYAVKVAEGHFRQRLRRCKDVATRA